MLDSPKEGGGEQEERAASPLPLSISIGRVCGAGPADIQTKKLC